MEREEIQSEESSAQRSDNSNNSKGKVSNCLRISRRTFIGVSAAASAILASAYIVKRPAFSLFSSPEEIRGEINEQWISTSCLNCPTRCATRVRTVDSKAVRIASNPLSRVSEGETCPRSHIGLQVLYDPGRIQSPLKRMNTAKGKGVDPAWEPISWDQALSDISNRLITLRDQQQPQKLLLLYGLNSNSNIDLISRFADAYGTLNVISEDALDNEAEKAGAWMADGHYTHSAYDLQHTNYILAFGASIIESQKPLARNLRMWGKIRRERANRVKVIVIDPRYSVTAAKADQWIPINPGTDAALAMGLANVIISEGLYDEYFIANYTHGFAEYREVVTSHYSPERVAEITGISPDMVRQTAREFARSKPAIAWRGRGATCWPNGSYTSYAIFCLNALVGSIDTPGGVIYQEEPKYREMPDVTEDDIAKSGKSQPELDLRRGGRFVVANMVPNQVADSILEDRPYPVEIAVGFNCNFNMSAPGTNRWDEAMAKIPYYVHIAPSMNEMSQYADIVLPSCTFLEDWAYEHCPPGSGFTEVKIKQPVVAPFGESRPIADIFFDLANLMGDSIGQSFSEIGDNAEGFVKYRTGNLISWSEFRGNGVWVGPDYEYSKYDRIFYTPSKKFEFCSGNLETAIKAAGISVANKLDLMPHFSEPEFLGEEAQFPLKLSSYHPLLDIENGNQNYPWAQEIYTVMHGQGWDNFVEINKKTADEIGVGDLSWVWVESSYGKLKARARVFEGIHPGVVAIACGQGHYNCGQWADGIGVNPNDIVGVDYDNISGQSSFFNTRVRIYKV